MKIELPDGRIIASKNLDTAPVDFVVELQRQTGLKLKEINERASDDIEGDVFRSKVVYFLSYRTAGVPLAWAEIGQKGFAELGRSIAEPGDPTAEGEAAPDPQEAASRTSDVASDQPPTEA